MVSALKTQHRDYRFTTIVTCFGCEAIDLYDEQEAFYNQEPRENTQQEEERCEKSQQHLPSTKVKEEVIQLI